MGDKLFPKEIIDHSSEANFSKHSVQTKLIYITVLLALVALLFALPLIDVTVSVKSQGLVKPITDRNQLVSLVSGHIEELYIKDNASVVRGEVVAEISAPVLQEKNQFIDQRKQKVTRYLSDLSVLLDIDGSQILNSFNLNENSRNENPIADNSSPLLQFKDQIEVAVQNIEEARQENIGSTAYNSSSNRKNEIALQHYRAQLWTLLHTNFSSFLHKDLKEKAILKRSLARFKQIISKPLKKIKEARKKYERHKLLNGRGIITDATYMQSQSELRASWEHLLAILARDSFSVLDIPAFPKQNPSPLERKKENENTITSASKPEEAGDLNLQTAKYRSSLLEFKQQVHNTFQKIRMAHQEYIRNKKLFERDVISEETYEKSSFALEEARNEFQLLFDQQRNNWQTDQTGYQDELDQLVTDQLQIDEKKEKYVIRAPISGTIQNMEGIYEGSPVSTNQSLAEISPDTSLIAECYIPPKDIGLLKEGMEARFQVTAFDYNQWGLLTGTIQEISNDVSVINERPVFKVRASLDQTWLELQNGYRGDLKKGMSLLARFKVTERSLFQLLYDNLDDWLNPKWDDPNEQTQQAAK